MEDYCISLQSIEAYNPSSLDTVLDKNSRGEEPEDCETLPEEEMTEDEFRTSHEEFNNQIELEMRPFVNWHISTCCLHIGQYMDELERRVENKPYVGLGLRIMRHKSDGRK